MNLIDDYHDIYQICNHRTMISIISLIVFLAGTSAEIIPTLISTSNWIGGGCFSMTLWNHDMNTVTSWKIDVLAMPTETIQLNMDEFWGSVFVADGIHDDHILITNTQYNGQILGRRIVSGIGFCLSYIPEVHGNTVAIIANATAGNVPIITTESTESTASTPTIITTTSSPPTIITTSSPPTIYPIPTPDPGNYWNGSIRFRTSSTWDGGMCITTQILNTDSEPARKWIMRAIITHPTKNIDALISESWNSEIIQDPDYVDNHVWLRSSENVFIFPGETKIGIGFCIEIVPEVNGNELIIEAGILLGSDAINTPPPTPPFTQELYNVSWEGNTTIIVTGMWEGGLCNTLIIHNNHNHFVAMNFDLVVTIGSQQITHVSIGDLWLCNETYDFDPNDNIVYLENQDIFIAPGDEMIGIGYCIDYLPSIHPRNLDYQVDVTLHGSYTTYPSVVPGGLNSVYLPHGYFVAYKTNYFIRRQVMEMNSLNVRYQYANIGLLDDEGMLPENQTTQLSRWIQQSRIVDPSQLIIAHINAYRDISILNISHHENIVDSCQRIILDTGADGIHFDFEPPRADPELIELLQAVRDTIGDKYISIAGSGARIRWPPKFIVEVAKIVDAVCPMLYDNNKVILTIPDYQEWVQDAISTYNAIYNAPGIRDGVEVLPILPAYTENVWHDPMIENLTISIPAIFQSMQDGMRVEGIGIWWWHDMTDIDKNIMKTMFVDMFGT